MARSARSEPDRPRRLPRRARLATTIAIVGCAAVVAGWMVPTLGSLAGGMDRADTLWYHMPLAAKFVQTGSLGDIFFFDPIFFASFYPSNSEVLHAVPILAFDRDIVSPVLNLGLLGIGLLAAWCIGRPCGVAPQALIGGSIALGAQMLVEFQAGEALNDIIGRRLHARRRCSSTATAGARYPGRTARYGGACAADKSPAAPRLRRPRGAGRRRAGRRAGGGHEAVVPGAGGRADPRRGRARAAGAAHPGRAALDDAAAASPAFYWYARNAIATGNPIPYIGSVGPIELPAPERDFELRPGFAVSHYLGDVDVLDDWFVPGLNESFGRLWPVTLLLMVGGSARSRSGAAWRRCCGCSARWCCSPPSPTSSRRSPPPARRASRSRSCGTSATSRRRWRSRWRSSRACRWPGGPRGACWWSPGS